jgi:3-dehydroquinate synthase
VRRPAEVLKARQGAHRYDVRVGPGAYEALPALAAGYDAVAIFTARPVLRSAAAREAIALLHEHSNVLLVHLLPDGERGKTLAGLEKAAGKLLASGATRRTLVVAVGGGAVTDAAGFLAATFMRGVAWVAVPTTLLGMVDAALGGKTAVNLPGAKNIVGAFHPPAAVLLEPRVLETLPAREIRSGMGEVVKYAALRPALLGQVTALRGEPPGPDLVAACARVKLEVVEADPTEQGERKLLNLGHTFGHGVEAAGGFRRYAHGEAIAVGLRFAFRLAGRLGRIGPLAVAELEDVLRGAGLPLDVPPAIARRARTLMATDKKRVATGLRWVLPRADDDSWTVEWDVAVDERAVDETLRDIMSVDSARTRRPALRSG